MIKKARLQSVDTDGKLILTGKFIYVEVDENDMIIKKLPNHIGDLTEPYLNPSK